MRTRREETEFKRGMRLGHESGVRDCAAYLLAWAAYYPADLFPAESPSVDARTATGLRIMLPRIAKSMREQVRPK